MTEQLPRTPLWRATRVPRATCWAALALVRGLWTVLLWPFLKWAPLGGLACAAIWAVIKFDGLAFNSLETEGFGWQMFLIASVGSALCISSVLTLIQVLARPDAIRRSEVLQTWGSMFLLGLFMTTGMTLRHDKNVVLPEWFGYSFTLFVFGVAMLWRRFGPNSKHRNDLPEELSVDA